MIYKFFKLLQGIQLILLISIVNFLQILSNFPAIIQEANLSEIKQQQQIKLLTFSKLNFIIIIDCHHSFNILKRYITIVL